MPGEANAIKNKLQIAENCLITITCGTMYSSYSPLWWLGGQCSLCTIHPKNFSCEHRFVGFLSKGTFLGNLREISVGEITNSPRALEFNVNW